MSYINVKLLSEEVIKKFGTIHQIDMVIEECAELIKALNKMKRAGLILPNKVVHPSEISKGTIYHDTCSEIADVKIMIAQLEIMFDPEFIQLSMMRKLQRLQNNLETKSEEEKCTLLLNFNYDAKPLIIHPKNNCAVVVSVYGFIKPFLGFYLAEDKTWYIFKENKYLPIEETYKFCDLWIKTWRFLTSNELDLYQRDKIIKFDE